MHGRFNGSVLHWRVAIMGAGADGLGLAIRVRKSRQRRGVRMKNATRRIAPQPHTSGRHAQKTRRLRMEEYERT